MSSLFTLRSMAAASVLALVACSGAPAGGTGGSGSSGASGTSAAGGSTAGSTGGASGTTGAGSSTGSTGRAPVPAAYFAARTLSLPGGDAFWQTDSTDAVHGGPLTYQVYVPSDAALAAKGWSDQPYRVLVALHGSAESGTDGTKQMTGSGSMGQLLGWNDPANQLGSGAVPSDPSSGYFEGMWPTLVVFPQDPGTWTGNPPVSGESPYPMRVMWQEIDLAVNQTCAEWGCDRQRIYLTGLSRGAISAFDYLYGTTVAPTHFTIRFAAFVPAAGAANPTLGAIHGVSRPADASAAAALAIPAIQDMPTWEFNSTNDGNVPPSAWNPTHDAYVSGGATAPDYHFNDTGTDHVGVWTTAYKDASGTLWPWLFGYHL